MSVSYTHLDVYKRQPVGFNVTDSDINAVIQQFMGVLQHAVRLAHSGHHTNVNLELSPSRTPYQVKKVLCSEMCIRDSSCGEQVKSSVCRFSSRWDSLVVPGMGTI